MSNIIYQLEGATLVATVIEKIKISINDTKIPFFFWFFSFCRRIKQLLLLSQVPSAQ
jgi:hypothetical protein